MTEISIKPKHLEEPKKLEGSNLQVGDYVLIGTGLCILTMSLTTDQKCCYSFISLCNGKPVGFANNPFVGSLTGFFRAIDGEIASLPMQVEYISDIEILWELEGDKQ